MHIDTDPAREWGERFPRRDPAFAVEIARDVLAETQAAVQPLVPHLDTLRWVFIAAALACTAVTIHARLDD
jgi:hypothetical protein